MLQPVNEPIAHMNLLCKSKKGVADLSGSLKIKLYLLVNLI